jgi:hypothetical protein
VPRLPALIAALALLCATAAGCGGDEDPSAATQPTTTAEPVQVDFPSGDDKTIRALRADRPEGAVFAPSVSALTPGENRIGFALFDVSRKQVEPEAVALYVARPDGRGLRGPYVAREESLRVAPQFQSRQTQADLDDIDAFWVADVPFREKGRYVVTALAQVDGELVSTSQFEMRVSDEGPPDVGDRAIRVNTDTPADVGGDIRAIDTREPPIPELHSTDFADVLGKRPVVLAFATPQLCQTRVCGPVVDVVAEVASRTRGVEFIAQEIYVDNDIEQGFRPQIAEWRLPTEPWTFVVGEDGRVVERFEGALSVRELEAAVRKVGQVG